MVRPSAARANRPGRLGSSVFGGPLAGPGGVIPATGRSFRCPMCAIFEFAPGSDRIICERVYFDAATIMQQLVGDEA